MEKMKKNPIKRLIALWVALALVIVPLATHVGEKAGTKAAKESETYIDTIDLENVNICLDGSILGTQAGKSYAEVAGPSEIEKIYFGNSAKLKIQIGQVTGPVSVHDTEDTELTSEQMAQITWDVKLKEGSKVSNDTDYAADVPSGVTESSVNSTTTIYVYARPNLQDVTGFSDVSTGYTLIATYQLVKLTGASDFLATVDWSATTTPVKSTSLTLTKNAKYAGALVYGYKKSSEPDSKIVWSFDAPTISATGTYTGYVGYSDGNTASAWIYKKTASNIVVDATSPTVSNDAIKLKKDGTDVTSDLKSNKYYDEEAEHTYRYEIEVVDNCSGTGSYKIEHGEDEAKTGQLSFTASGSSYKATLSAAAIVVGEADAEDVVLTVEDALGNVKSSIKLPKVVKVDKTLHFTTAPSVTGGTVNADGYSHDVRALGFTVQSGSKITKVVVNTGSEDKVYNVSSSQLENQNYSYTSNITLPCRPNNENVKYDDIQGIKITVYDEADNHVTKTLTEAYKYDGVAPTSNDTDENGRDTWLAVKHDGESDYSRVQEFRTDVPGISRYVIIDAKTAVPYRYYARFEDVGYGVEKVYGCFRQDFPESNTDYPIMEFTRVTDPSSAWYGDDWFYLDLNKADYAPYQYRQLYVKAVDYADNTCVREFGMYLTVPDTELKITEAVLKNPQGTVVTLPISNVITNKAYTLKVTATSGSDVTSLYIMDGATLIDGLSKDVTSLNVWDNSSMLNTVEYTFTIPAGTNLNMLLKDMSLYAEDGLGDIKSVKIGKLLYDNTNPKVRKASGAPLLTETGWYTSFPLDVKVTVGTDDKEANLTAAYYSITNAKVGDIANQALSIDETGKAATATIDVPESKTVGGTVITVIAKDEADNELNSGNVEVVRVDKTQPEVENIKVNGVQNISTPVAGTPTISAKVKDNLAISRVEIVVTDPLGNKLPKTFAYEDGQALATGESGIELSAEYKLTPSNGASKLSDGTYLVEATVYDKAGTASSTQTAIFKVDNTAPELTAKIVSGTAGGKLPGKNFDGSVCDYYYRSNVGVQLTYEDDNVDQKNIVVTDNGKTVNVSWTKLDGINKYIANYTASAEGKHTIKISGADKTGNKAQDKQITFIRDVASPSISAIINGGRYYTDGMGMIDISANAVVSFSVSDSNDDANDFNYRVIKKLPDQPATTSNFIKTQNRSFTFTDEAEYTVEVYSVDMAGNQSATKSVSFRVDKMGPELSVAGISNGGTSANASSVSFVMKEAFWKDATGTVNIYRKAGDSSAESLYKTISYTPTGFMTSISETLTETGAYRFEFDARDGAGHTSSLSQTFTIDRDAPVITLTGVNNYDKTSSDVNFMAQVTDDFYASKKVTVTGTREDAAGKKNPIEFSSYNVAGNPTVISEAFKDSGIYDIEVASEDMAGNKDVQSVHFTIDKDNPKIGKLPIEDGAVLTSFDWDVDLEDLVTDLTVCKVHMYLNGSEYDGSTELEDGTYTILITAEDENGNYTDNSDSPVTFVLDTKAPTFIVTGVEDGEAKKEAYNINVSLQLEEDTLENVALNGKAIDIVDNVATLEVSTKGNYKLTMTAVDKAGNKAEQTISFTYGEKSHWWIWLIIAACVLLLAGIGVAVVKKKNE